MVCCLSHSAQQFLQISVTMRAPMAPGNGGRSNPSRASPQRVQVTSAMSLLRHPDVSAFAGVLHFGESQDRQEPDVHPADVELEPAVRELGGTRVGMMVVVQFLASDEDADGRDVAAFVLHVVV